MAGEPLTVYGDGTQTRDFVFVTDLADGLIRAAETPGVGGEIFQLASGVETSLNELVGMLGEVSGRAPRCATSRRGPARSSATTRWSTRRAAELGYEPEVALARRRCGDLAAGSPEHGR